MNKHYDLYSTDADFRAENHELNSYAHQIMQKHGNTKCNIKHE